MSCGFVTSRYTAPTARRKTWACLVGAQVLLSGRAACLRGCTAETPEHNTSIGVNYHDRHVYRQNRDTFPVFDGTMNHMNILGHVGSLNLEVRWFMVHAYQRRHHGSGD